MSDGNIKCNITLFSSRDFVRLSHGVAMDIRLSSDAEKVKSEFS